MTKLFLDRVDKAVAIGGLVLLTAHVHAMAFQLSALKNDMGGVFASLWIVWLSVVLYRCLIKRFACEWLKETVQDKTSCASSHMPSLTAGEAIAAASGSIVGLLADINIALTADQMGAREGWTVLPKVYLVADHCVVAITPVLCLLGPVLGIGILTAVRG